MFLLYRRRKYLYFAVISLFFIGILYSLLSSLGNDELNSPENDLNILENDDIDSDNSAEFDENDKIELEGILSAAFN